MQTGEEIGFEGAIRQVHRTLAHRLKALQEKPAAQDDSEQRADVEARIDEVSRLLDVIKSLHY